MRKCISFDDVLITPKFSDIVSRSEIDLTSSLGNLQSEIPIVSSPMDTVTETSMAEKISSLGRIGIIHRYNSPEEQADLVSKCNAKNVGFAVGVGEDMIERAQKCVHAGANLICIDVSQSRSP